MAAIVLVVHFEGDGAWWSALVWKVPDPAWIAVAGIGLIPTLAIKRMRPAKWAAAAALVLAIIRIIPCFGGRSEVRASDLKVLQLNMEHGLEGVDKVAALIERERPDILCLEEAGPLSFYPDRTPLSLSRALTGYRVFHSTFEVLAVRGEILEERLVDIPEMEHERTAVDQKVLTTALCSVKGRRVRVAAFTFLRGPRRRGDLWLGGRLIARFGGHSMRG
jgi:hypothetical protein